MKKVITLLAVFVLCLGQTGYAEDESSYLIGRGDTLEVYVWGYPELDHSIVVRPDGNISFPLIEGEIEAEGKTPEQLDRLLTTELSKELKDPKVTVIVARFSSKKIWVCGEVEEPGAYPFTGFATALESIIQAGGYKRSACLRSVLIIRNRDTRNPEAFLVNLDKVIKKQEITSDVWLQPGDIVYVPRSFISRVDGFLDFFKDAVHVGAYYELR
ncbi:MAG: polysaccharide biosynthesis/export family protein [Candidatus Omnitrophica bacterium]|nr:polysaccharide biosynthesis/export family protein [Candidatus Omnitrophota bacterium]